MNNTYTAYQGIAATGMKDYLNPVTATTNEDELKRLRSENANLRQQLSDQQSQLTKIQTGRYFNNDLIQENQNLRNELTRVKTDSDLKSQKIAELESKLRSNGIYSSTTTTNSWETKYMQTQIDNLKKELLDKQNKISELESKQPTSYYGGLQQNTASIRQLNDKLDKCQLIGNRMIDRICQVIPEWQNCSAQVCEIKCDVVCMMENIENILNDFLDSHANSPANVNSINQLILDERNRLAAELNFSTLPQVANDLYYSAYKASSYLSSEDKIKSVANLIKSISQQLSVTSLQDISREVAKLQSDLANSNRELQQLQYIKNQPGYLNPSVNLESRRVLSDMAQRIDEIVMNLNNAMNNASVIVGINIGQEEETQHHGERSLMEMFDDNFNAYWERQKELLDTRVHDTCQIIEILINAVQTERQNVAEQQQKNADAIKQISSMKKTATNTFTNSNPTPIYEKQTIPTDLFSAREREIQAKDLLEDCQKFIQLYTDDLKTRRDTFLIRSASPDSLLTRLQNLLGTSALTPLTSTEFLLLLRRLVDKEKILVELQDKDKMILDDRMRLENERDKAKKEKAEVESKLTQKEMECARIKEDMKMNPYASTQPLKDVNLYGTTNGLANSNPYSTTAYSYTPLAYTYPPVTQTTGGESIKLHSMEEVTKMIDRVNGKINSIRMKNI